MITDSSVLIIFARVNKLNLLFDLYERICITQGIYKEAIEDGLSINAPDAEILNNFLKDKKIEVYALDKKHEEISKNLREIYSNIGIGESEAIALALQKKDKLILDESAARKIARLYNLNPIGSLRVLLDAFKKNIIDEKEIKAIINEMIKNKFRLGAEVITEFWTIFNKLKKKK